MTLLRLQNGDIDRQFLRVRATIRLLKEGKIDGKQAADFLMQVNIGPQTVERWKRELGARQREALDSAFRP